MGLWALSSRFRPGRPSANHSATALETIYFAKPWTRTASLIAGKDYQVGNPGGIRRGSIGVQSRCCTKHYPPDQKQGARDGHLVPTHHRLMVSIDISEFGCLQ
jgi:hypothetical protein